MLPALRLTSRALRTVLPAAIFSRPMSSSLAYTPERAADLKENLEGVLAEVRAVSSTAQLVAVSKLKPASDIQALYDAGYRHFGENYIQELSDKAKELPADIQWHFIGNLQSNKVKLATAIPNLFVLETLDSAKKADLLDKQLDGLGRTQPLNVYVQINTSGEDAKAGIPPLAPSSSSPPPADAPALELALHVVQKCPRLRLLGLMTIGSWDASHAAGTRNPDFVRLVDTRAALVDALKQAGVEGNRVGREGEEWRLELSMGMSADFAEALKEGSDSVRVGTRIFGERPPKRSA